LLTINPKKDTVSLTSFPRDLYVYIPGYTIQRINTAYGWGGIEALFQTFEYNFGVRPDYYALITFNSFRKAIDNLGGIDVNVAETLSDYRGTQWYTIEKGVNHMNGHTALWYARSRKSTSDLARNRRQQEVLQAVFDRFMNIDVITRFPELYEIYGDNVETDIGFVDVLTLLPLAVRIRDGGKIKRYYIAGGEVTNWITPEGAMVLLPNRDAILDVMRQALKSP
jgi:LCP family protein required for cell wall assembly